MPCYIKGGGGVQTPCLPHVGLKEYEGEGGSAEPPSPSWTRGPSPLPPLVVRLPLLGPLRAYVGGLPLFPLLFNN